MASRGSKLSRALQYFREADPDEARVAHVLVNEIMAKRLKTPVPGKPGRKPRAKTNGAASGATSATHSDVHVAQGDLAS